MLRLTLILISLLSVFAAATTYDEAFKGGLVGQAVVVFMLILGPISAWVAGRIHGVRIDPEDFVDSSSYDEDFDETSEQIQAYVNRIESTAPPPWPRIVPSMLT